MRLWEGRRSAGFTLLELLAALTLAALAVGALGAAGLGESNEGRVEAAVETVLDLDRRARALATCDGASTLDLGAGRVYDADGSIAVERPWPVGVDVRLAAPRAPLRFDRRGTRSDYRFEITGGRVVREATIHRHSGWLEEVVQ